MNGGKCEFDLLEIYKVNHRMTLAMEQVYIKVKMFGDFSVLYNDEMIISDNNRNNKVVELFHYLLLKHGRARQEDLISILLSENDYIDPYHTLKNLVYRLRKYLVSSGLPSKEYIRFHKGSYSLGEFIIYELDVEQFENAVKNAEAENSSQENRLKYCMEAISLYTGEFLSKSTNTLWVMPQAVRFKDMYLQSIKMLYHILIEDQRLASMIDLFEKALTLYPFEEDLRIMYISCLYALNRIKEAVSEYDSASALLFDELGIGPSPRMIELYKKISETLNPHMSSLSDIRNEMNENSVEKGAYYCNYQVFTDTYRFVVRQAERNGQCAFLMLITFTENKSSDEIKKALMQKISAAFHNAVKNSLRRGDLYTRYSPRQFVLLLTNIKQENCRTVSNRITENFFRQIRGKPMKLSFKAISAIDIDRVMSG